jgi:hypothetical protein
MAELLQPKELVVEGEDGKTRTFILSKFDAVEGREIVFQYPMSGLPKVGDYKLNEETMFRLMAYVAVPVEGGNPIRLTTKALVNNHVGDWETLFTIEKEMMKYNCRFFRDGRLSNFFDDVAQIVLAKISEMLTNSSEPSSPAEKPLSTNSEPFTP